MSIKNCLTQIISLLESINRNTQKNGEISPPQAATENRGTSYSVSVTTGTSTSSSLDVAFVTSLKPYQTWLAGLKADQELAKLLLGNTQDEEAGTQFVRAIAVASQWNSVERLWQAIEQRTKSQQRPATAAEFALLKGAVELHNLIWHASSHKARLEQPELGTPYKFEQHQRGNAVGETIAQVWLPQLTAPNSSVAKKAIVETK